ncbi:MAG: DNA-directed RNA polymerase subunit H [archaeon]|nr:MAG: DNA-directed RNA polymerase subunit H [archaeon]
MTKEKDEKGTKEEEKEVKENEEKEFEITDHFLVPKHEIMGKKEKEKLLKDYNITEKQLPKILISDPIIKLIDAKIGDVIKITRKSQVAAKSVYYRIVSK